MLRKQNPALPGDVASFSIQMVHSQSMLRTQYFVLRKDVASIPIQMLHSQLTLHTLHPVSSQFRFDMGVDLISMAFNHSRISSSVMATSASLSFLPPVVNPFRICPVWWSKGEQSTALSTATELTLQELFEWNARYREKFGFVFLICASGRSTPEILAELKIRYQNRPIIEFEIAAQEQMKITELRLSKLFSDKADTATAIKPLSTTNIVTKAEDRVNIIGAHLTAAAGAKPAHIPIRTRPPITTHVLDTSRGCPANGIEVRLEMWKDNQARPQFGETYIDGWILLGSSATDKDGRSGQLMNMVEALVPGVYRISFNTGKYNPDGFFPYVSIVFEIRESQKWDHFHVPLLLSPFSLSTYRGS